MSKDWKEYENQIFKEFKERYPNQVIEFNQKIKGRYSNVKRQIDILIKAQIGDSTQMGVFDCKKFNSKINVKSIDSMVGYMDDLNANYGGIITCVGFSKGAEERAKANNIKLEVIKFENPLKLIDYFIPSLNFSDPRNSGYIPFFT